MLGVLLAETGRGQSWPLSHVGVPFSQPRPAMCSRAGLPISPRSKAPAVISLTSSAWHELPTPQVRAKAAPQARRRAAGIVEGLPFIFADSPTHSPWAGPQGSRLLSLAPGQWRQVTAKQLPVLQASGAGTSSTPASPSPVPLRDPLTSSISAAGFCAHPSLPPFLPFPLSPLFLLHRSVCLFPLTPPLTSVWGPVADRLPFK